MRSVYRVALNMCLDQSLLGKNMVKDFVWHCLRHYFLTQVCLTEKGISHTLSHVIIMVRLKVWITCCCFAYMSRLFRVLLVSHSTS